MMRGRESCGYRKSRESFFQLGVIANVDSRCSKCILQHLKRFEESYICMPYPDLNSYSYDCDLGSSCLCVSYSSKYIRRRANARWPCQVRCDLTVRLHVNTLVVFAVMKQICGRVRWLINGFRAQVQWPWAEENMMQGCIIRNSLYLGESGIINRMSKHCISWNYGMNGNYIHFFKLNVNFDLLMYKY